MRICLAVLSGITLAAGASVAFADDVMKKDVPQAVLDTIEKEAQGAVIEDVERETKNGAVYYEVELERDNQEWKIKIDETGKVMERKRDT